MNLTKEERRYLLKLVKKEHQKAIQKTTSMGLLEKIYSLIDKLSSKSDWFAG